MAGVTVNLNWTANATSPLYDGNYPNGDRPAGGGPALTDPARRFTLNRSFDGTSGVQTSLESNGFSEADGDSTYTNEITPFAGTTCGKLLLDVSNDAPDFKQDVQSFGWWGGYFNFPNDLNNGDELFVKYYYYMPTGYVAGVSDWIKDFRIHVTDSVGGNRWYLDWQWGGSSRRFLIEGTLPEIVETFGDYATTPQVRDAWYEVRIHVIYGTGTNGSVKYWLNDTLIHSLSGIETMSVSTDKSDNIKVHTTWNGTYPGANQSTYIDSVLITSDRDVAVATGDDWGLA